VKICVDTTVQEYVADAFLGRVFSLYDMLFNAALVLGAAVSAPFMPVDGKSYPLIAVVAMGFLLAAAGYGILTRGQPRSAQQPRQPAPARR
jgi:hypothetical protein